MAKINIKTATKVIPQCYAYTTPGVPKHDGWTKIGFTERDVETRINEQTHTVGVEHKTWWHMRAVFMTEPFGTFTDKNFHAYLKKLGIPREEGTEWFQIAPDTARADFMDFTQNHGVVSDDDADAVIPYKLRDEQEDAVQRAYDYFKSHKDGEYLWNCKPRFGKTLSAYDLCRRLQATNILIVTNRPAIANSWYQDYETFFGPQSGYFFVSNADGIRDRKYVLSRDEYMKKVVSSDEGEVKGCIEFVSLQDLKGSIYFGGRYDKLVEVSAEHGLNWDVLIIDEAHEGVDTYKTDTAFNHINRKCTLHLSGTPFKALANDKFPQEAIYNWTYADEQKKKRDWDDSSEIENPYENLPRLSLFTYQMSEIIRDKVRQGIELADDDVEEYAFDLNEFFKTNESGRFVHDKDVDKFLDALTTQEKFPFSTPELRDELKHTFWILNRVASAKALYKKLSIHPVFKDYHIILAAGDGRLDDDDENRKSYDKVVEAIENYDKTITLSVGQLTTGVTIPEWTAVLMLSNMKSPALYMQAAFRAQNPCLFHDRDGNSYRKKNAYIFDFDPARTLTIFEKFANDLIPETSGDKGEMDQRRNNVRQLLNFFPVYGEDDGGEMVELDAESVLTIPRHIHAKEVVDRGFMSNFLFANISGIFGAPKEIIKLINDMQPLEQPKKLSDVGVDENTADDLHLNEDGKVDIPTEKTIGLASDLFGEKVYGDVDEKLAQAVSDLTEEHARHPDPKKDELESLREKFSEPIADTLMETATKQYGDELKKSTQNQLKRDIQATTENVVNREYGDYTIHDNQLKKKRDDEIKKAKKSGASMAEISSIDEEFEKRRQQSYQQMLENIHKKLNSEETARNAAEKIVNTVETEKLNAEKDSIEGRVRDHLRGFSRTIPAFLMAYGDEGTTLENFDSLVPENVFWEVTVNPQNGVGVTLEQFRMLRDGGDYQVKDDNGNAVLDDNGNPVTKHFDGHLFDEVVFNDAVQEFMKKRRDLSDYFSGEHDEDIFNYIPPQRTNQIFTPKKVVKEMVDMLEKENPGCFDDPDATFADLYMKSGMYITEIVKRLFLSRRMKALFPDDTERLNHIFAKQVYGCAPTEIIYRICLRYILGFSDKIRIEKHNIKLCDTLEFAKEGTLEDELSKLFALN
ncbi:MAG: restriction endonuclease [bacterium LCO1.1]|uniref:Restriction endonuclease n=1 Tax=Candidatus Weimeria bifida TaxID=2599074 RepID=A0A6N7IYA7_9FIRM|nr:restriction endonuclease [Candidatus Weimeria bifida]